jgi:hypothetical protein
MEVGFIRTWFYILERPILQLLILIILLIYIFLFYLFIFIYPFIICNLYKYIQQISVRVG